MMEYKDLRTKTAGDLMDLALDALSDGWEHPDGREPPISRRHLIRFIQALQPEKPVRDSRHPQLKRTGPGNAVFGFSSVRIQKNPSQMVWHVFSVPPASSEAKSVELCKIGWRHAFDPTPLRKSSAPGDFLAALEACLTLAPLTGEEIAQVHKIAPGLERQDPLRPKNPDKWIPQQVIVEEPAPAPVDQTKKKTVRKKKGKLWLKRKVLRD